MAILADLKTKKTYQIENMQIIHHGLLHSDGILVLY